MRPLNRNHLKYIAVLAMFIDHFAHYFLSHTWGSPIYTVCRFTGRLTAPIMCFFLAEGFFYTKNRKKYFLRLFIFAIISEFAYDFAHGTDIFNLDFSMIYTLLMCFLMLYAIEYIKIKPLKLIPIALGIFLCSYGDWSYYAALWVLVFYFLHGERHLTALGYLAICILYILKQYIMYAFDGYNYKIIIYSLGTLMFIPLLYLYNGNAGKKNAFNKWFFYIIYPLHLFVIGMVRLFIL